MTNILQLPKVKKTFSYRIESMKLDDGSYWCRWVQLWDGKQSEWRKIE